MTADIAGVYQELCQRILLVFTRNCVSFYSWCLPGTMAADIAGVYQELCSYVIKRNTFVLFSECK